MQNQPTSQPPTPEMQIHQLQQELIQAQQMAALGELVGTTTHEFNNILMTILNYAKLGIRHSDAPTREKALNKIMAAAQRAEKITSSVLGMARNRNVEFAPTDLQPLLEQSLVLLEREMQKYRIQVQREFSEVPPVRAIGNQIQQVLLNLMTNARQAMPNGGQLILGLSLDHEHKMVDLTIRDSGSGIEREQLPKIFDRYFTTKSGPDATGKGGTGVGLSTCRDIIEAHQGRIRVESTVGRGTAFTIKLPLSTPEEQPQTSQPVTQLGIPTEVSSSPG